MKKIRFIIFILIIFSAFCQHQDKKVSKEKELKELLQRDSCNVEVLLELGIYYHDKTRPKEAIEVFERLLNLDKENPVACVYLGSSWTIMADKAEKVEDKLRYLEKGTRLLDEAVEKFPDNYTVRLVRGINSACLPEMFGRFRLTIKDLEYLLEDGEKIPQKDLPMILSYLATAYKMDNQPQKAAECERRIREIEEEE
jgi:tetratricopeptide (TPR) repeat protein